MKYRDLLKQLKDDGWQHIRTTGSHLHYKHPAKPFPGAANFLTTSLQELCVPFFAKPD